MEITKSVRKRAGQVIPDEFFASPSFEEGRKSVPEAEMEHVSPVVERKNEADYTRRAPARRTDDNIKERIAEVLENINSYTEQITDLVARIDAERENLKRISSEL